MARVGAWPPVVAVTQSFDADVARTLLQMRVADFLVKPVAPVDWCAPARASPGADRRRRADRGADLHLPARGRRRRRHHAGGPDRDAAAQQRGQRGKSVDLPGRSRFPARRRAPTISISSRGSTSTEIEPRPDRLDRQLLEVMLSHHASGLAVIAAPNRPAEMRTLRSRRGDAAARPGVDAFRLCRVRHAAHLVLLDRQRAARLQQAVHRQRNDGAGPAPRQAAGGGDQASGSATGRSRRSSSTASSSGCSRPACDAADIEQALGDAFAGTHPQQLSRWCARRSTAACRSTRSSPATRSPRSSRSWCCRKRRARPRAKRDAARWQEAQARRVAQMRNAAMAGRFTARRAAAPELAGVEEPPPRRRSMAWPGRCFRKPPSRRRRRPQPANPLLHATSCSTPRCACTAG